MMDPRWKHPFTCLVSGPTSCGKTQFVKRLVEHAEDMIVPPPQKIVWFYKAWQKAYSEMPNVHFIEGLPTLDMMDPACRNLFVIDDHMEGINQTVVDMFKIWSHHKNTSIVFISQNLFSGSEKYREMSRNSHYNVIFKCPRDVSQIGTIAKQMYPGKGKFMYESFEDATSEPYAYMLVDTRSDTPNAMRLRAKIFPGELQEVYIKT